MPATMWPDIWDSTWGMGHGWGGYEVVLRNPTLAGKGTRRSGARQDSNLDLAWDGTSVGSSSGPMEASPVSQLSPASSRPVAQAQWRVRQGKTGCTRACHWSLAGKCENWQICLPPADQAPFALLARTQAEAVSLSQRVRLADLISCAALRCPLVPLPHHLARA